MTGRVMHSTVMHVVRSLARFRSFRLFTVAPRHTYCHLRLTSLAQPHSLCLHVRNFESMASTVEYGAWRSPVSSQLATASAVSFQEVHVDGSPGAGDAVYWSELRYEEGGRYVVCSQHVGNKEGFAAWTPAAFNARTRVHEYGGGAHFVHDGSVYFSNMADQRMYRQMASGADPTPITPAEGGWRYADGHFHHQLKKIFVVREDHGVVERKEAKEAKNTVVCIDPDTQEQNVLASGCDFYSSPRVSPDGQHVAWVQWNHPNMPWDDTELWVADLQSAGNAVVEGSAKKVAGGPGVSVMHPRWTPDNTLIYVGDQTEWWNLYLVPSTGGDHINLLPCTQEIAFPHWVFGDCRYVIDPTGSGDVIIAKDKELGVVNIKTSEYRVVDTGFSSHANLTQALDGHVYCTAGGPTCFPCVIRVNTTSGKVDVVRESKVLSLDTGYISVPQEISWTTDGDQTSHGYFYPPQNKDYIAPTGTLPPLLIQVHGGPTAATGCSLNLKKQYFTSRGFGILDVNYRGSTGYGRPYRNALREQWGVVDVEDCRSGAMHLSKKGLVDENRVCIDGGSAGGYTTLACIAFTDAFKAGASHYGVADVELLAAETHKFESRYMDSLVAPLNDQTKHIYQERSPLANLDGFKCPIIFFQGDEDEWAAPPSVYNSVARLYREVKPDVTGRASLIVPPNQAVIMYEKLKAKGIVTALVMFAGEQHGFRKAENIQAALDGEFYFFSKAFGFTAADNNSKLDIANLS